MSQSMRRLILVALAIHVGSTQRLLVVGPHGVRSNQEYKMVITNFNTTVAYLEVRMEGYTDDGLEILNLYKNATVRGNMNLAVDFQLPNLVPGNYKITMDGQRGFSFHKEVELEFISKSISGLIQLDKPVYKPGDSVHLRVIVLDDELKPPANVKSVNVAIKDPRGNVIRKWSTGRLHVGVFEAKLEIALTPLLGIWSISVKVDGDELVSKTFEVKEYVLSNFDVDVFPTTIPLEEHGGLNLTISAKNVFGQPVSGKVELTLFSTSSLLEVKATRQVAGKEQLEMRYDRPLEMYGESEEVNLNFTFTEQYTNRSIAKSLQFTVYKAKYTAKLIREIPRFLPGKVFRATVKVEHRNGSPARSVNCNVKVSGSLEESYDKQFVTDEKGEIPLQLEPSEGDILSIKVSVEGQSILDEDIEEEQNTESFIKIAPGKKSGVQTSKDISLQVICRGTVKFLVYYVLSKGNVIYQDFIRSVNTRFDIKIKYSDKMVPTAKVLVATVINNTVLLDIKDIVSPDLLNNFEMSLEDDEVKPGEQIQLQMTGRPESYVALAAYDKSLLQYGSSHDVLWSDVHDVYNSLHQIEYNSYDLFESNGLFAKISDTLDFDDASGISKEGRRNGNVQKQFPTRTNFAESFLWRNATLDRSGRFTLLDVAPDTTTAWCLTGFSVHPKYGLGIVKRPLQLDTVKAFYIVDHLPYSIKRGEVVTLQFTIFNNLGADFITEVMVFNNQEQMEFVDHPTSISASNHSEVLAVRQTVGVPVSFLVKAKKLGEMIVRVKATNMIEMDAIEKVIRVMPESLVEKKLKSHIFCQNSYLNTSFTYNLNVDENADPGSQKITFTIDPNIATTVSTNLENLLDVPTGCGEQNMIRFVPNVVVLDYLVATGSKDTKLINKATNLLRQGYQNQMKYRQTDGSFGVWQTSGGSVFLTAFVAKSMKSAAKHISEVNNTMVVEAFKWLASKQQSDGRFNEVGEVIHTDMQGGLRSGIALTSYVLIAFMENEQAKVTHAGVVAKGIEYVASMLTNVTDLYDLSIATYALMLNNHTKKDQYLQRLIGRSTSTPQGTMRYWERQPHGIETTAYALLAMIQAKKHPDGVPVMRWLVNQRYVTGSFPRTQDTFVGLKALTNIVEQVSTSRNDYTVELKYKRTQNTFIISHSNLEAQTFAEIPSDVREITAYVAGVGFGLLDVKYEYSLDLRNYSRSFDLTLQKLNTYSDDKLQLKVCANYIPWGTRSNMALVEVNFPSGYVVDNNPISEATRANPIKNIEIRFGATSVAVYYNSMGREANCFRITAYRRFKVSLKRPAYVLVHDYYNPKLNAMQVYQLDE